jgi:hypothetical protein
MNGISIYDDLVKILYDEERDIEYPAWTCINNEKMADRADKNALPVIFSIKCTSSEMNHQIAMGLRGALQKGKLKLLVNELEGREILSQQQVEEFDKLEEAEKGKMLRPYIQTTATVNEMINLEWSMDSGWVKVFETGRNRKDRYSAVAYANYFADIKERDLESAEEIDEDDDIVYF